MAEKLSKTNIFRCWEQFPLWIGRFFAHFDHSGIGRNWFIERLNREIKRRLKWFSTFQSIKGSRAFFGMWFYNFNKRKSAHIT